MTPSSRPPPSTCWPAPGCNSRYTINSATTRTRPPIHKNYRSRATTHNHNNQCASRVQTPTPPTHQPIKRHQPTSPPTHTNKTTRRSTKPTQHSPQNYNPKTTTKSKSTNAD